MTRYRALIVLWLLTDLGAFLDAYALAYFLRVGWIFSTDFPFGRYFTVAALVAPVAVLTLVVTRTFALTRNQRSARAFLQIGYACTVATALFALAYYFLYGLFFSRLLILEALALSVAALWLWHIVYQRVFRALLRRDPPAFPLLVIGATREAAHLIAALERERSPLKPVAILDGRGGAERSLSGVPVFGKLNLLEETLTTLRITHLIQCSDLEQSINLLGACRARGITYLLLPTVLGIVERSARVDMLESQPITVVRPDELWWTWPFR